MGQKMYEVKPPKKKKNVISVQVDVTKLPSAVHKYGALNNKAVVFDDRRKRKPKYKPNYMED
jgi:hypothetical protein